MSRCLRAACVLWTRFAVAAVLLLTCFGCSSATAAKVSRPTIATPTFESATRTWRAFNVGLVTKGLRRDDANKVTDSWKVARCVIRSEAFWTAADRLTGDESAIMKNRSAGARVRQVAARQMRWWHGVYGRPGRLRVVGTALPHRQQHEKYSATVQVGGNVIFLRRWHITSSIEELAVTLVHEWLHTLEFRDPRVEADPVNVVYGMKPAAMTIAATRRCQEELTVLYINPTPTLPPQ